MFTDKIPDKRGYTHYQNFENEKNATCEARNSELGTLKGKMHSAVG